MRAIAKYVAAVISLCSCTAHTIYHTNAHVSASVHLARALNIVLSWPSPANVNALRGAVLIRDGPKVDTSELAIARAMLRTNPRLTPGAALLFAGATVDAANAHGLPPDFLAATLLQESAYDPNALSSAGAIGIAQFMPETAAGAGVDPYDPFDSIEGAAALLGGYAGAYTGRYADPYTAALAAYNAGPLAVEHYGGIPPYPETQQYVALIFDRWARIVSYEHGRAP
jgi:soluble lytic murein transglycosylase-like protein